MEANKPLEQTGKNVPEAPEIAKANMLRVILNAQLKKGKAEESLELYHLNYDPV